MPRIFGSSGIRRGLFKLVIGKRVLFAVPERGANLLMIVLRLGATWLHLLEHLEPF